MNTLWNKIRADLWLFKARTLPAILSIAAGVFCVGALFGMIDLQLSKMDLSHQLSQPAHINLILRQNTSAELLNRIKTIEGVSNIDLMNQLHVRFKQTTDSEWTLATLMTRPTPSLQKFDKTTLQSGTWPTNEHIAIERLSAQYTGLQAGDKIELETATGAHVLTISGTVRHPFVKPPLFGGQVHFFIDASNAPLTGIQDHTYRQVLVQITPPYSAEKSRQIAHQIRALLNTHQVAVNATLLQNPSKHWGRKFLAGVDRVLQLMAVTSLALASVLILNTLIAHISQQTNQIGIMKSLGAGTLSIAALYLYEALIMALIAVMLAMPASLAAAYFSSCALLDLFNIDCGGFDYSSRAIIYMLSGGLLAPLLAALGPVLRGAGLPVREAISHDRVSSNFGLSLFDRCLDRIGARLLPTLYAAALGNLFRRKGQLLLTQSVLIIAGMMFLVLMSLIASVNLTLDNEMARSQYDVRLGFSEDQSGDKVTELAHTLAETEKVEIWQRLPMEISKKNLPLKQKGSLGVQLLAVPAASKMYHPYIEKGRWLQAADAGQSVIVLSIESAALNDIEVGDSVSIQLGPLTASWRVIGLYRWLAGSGYTVEPVYAPLEAVQKLTGRTDSASFALLDAAINSVTKEARFMQALKQRFQENGIKLNAYTTLAKLKQRQFAINQFNPVIYTLLGLALMIAIVGGVGLSGTLLIGVLQRIREIGILSAIGAPSKVIFRLFLLEGLFHGLLSWVISVPLAYVAAEPIARLLGKTMLGIQLDFVFELSAPLYWLTLITFIACLASYWPARKAAQLTVRECLGH